MALLKQCFCYSLRQGSFIIGSYSLVVYCVAFAVELWWIVESLLILPAPAYTLCALYFFDFIMAAILLFGLLVRQRKYLMSWTLMTVLSFFPEAGMVLFMSLYYWPVHKFEYGVIELVYWSLRAIFNIFGAVCVCSLYLTWRDEELILGRLHDLTLANVETGSTGVGVHRNYTGTLKGNSNLAYQNYAYVDSSPGLPDNLSYKNSNNFHSKKCNSPTSLRSFFIRQQRNTKQYNFSHHNHRYCAQCHLVSLSNNYINCCLSNSTEKCITSLPILWTDASPSVAACCLANGGAGVGYIDDADNLCLCTGEQEDCLKYSSAGCRANSLYFGGGNSTVNKEVGGGGACGAVISDGRIKTLFYSAENNSACTNRNGYEKFNAPLRHFKCSCFHHCHPRPFFKDLRRSTGSALWKDSVLTSLISPKQLHHRKSEPIGSGDKCRTKTDLNLNGENLSLHSLKCAAASALVKSSNLVKDRHSFSSTSSQSAVEVPKIEIVICTEIHGSVETKVIRRTHHQCIADSHITNCKQAYRYDKFIPLRQFRRAMSDSPRSVIKKGAGAEGFAHRVKENEKQLSSVNSVQADAEISVNNSTTSIIVDEKHRRRGKGGCKAKEQWCKRNGRAVEEGKGADGGGGSPLRLFHYLASAARCCITHRSATSLISESGSQVGGGLIGSDCGGDKLPSGAQRGLFNTRSFTMNSDVQATLGNRGSLAMKSEFNPAMLFDPAYRKSRISELGIAGIGLEPPGQIPIGTFNRMNRSHSLWNVSNEEYWNRPPPSRPVSMGYVNHIHQLDQLNNHKDCYLSVNNNSNATMNLNKQMIMKGFGGTCGHNQGYRNPIHSSTTSIATSNHPGMLGGGHDASCGTNIMRDPDHRRNWLATGRRAQSVDGLNHFYHRYYGRNIAAHHNLHPSGIINDHNSQDWSKSSLCAEDPDDLRNYQDIAL